VGPAGLRRNYNINDLERTETIGIPDVSLCLSQSIVSAFCIVERDDGLFEIGLFDPIGPFPSRRFAESVAGKEVRDARTS
jgi:hypothetical protein